MLAAMAGVLIVPVQQAHYLMGLDPLLLSFIVVIIGGLGSLKGTVVAAFVIGISDGMISVFFFAHTCEDSRHTAGCRCTGDTTHGFVWRRHYVKRCLTHKVLLLHLSIVAGLFLAQFFLPEYHHTNLARIMVLATFAAGYNVLFGYTGLMSLGHAMFFTAGMYATGLSVYYLDFGALSAFFLGLAAAAAVAVLFGLFALRTSGVSFLIVTMMFGQACYLTILYFNTITLG